MTSLTGRRYNSLGLQPYPQKVVRPPWHPPQPSSQEVVGALGIERALTYHKHHKHHSTTEQRRSAERCARLHVPSALRKMLFVVLSVFAFMNCMSGTFVQAGRCRGGKLSECDRCVVFRWFQRAQAAHFRLMCRVVSDDFSPSSAIDDQVRLGRSQ